MLNWLSVNFVNIVLIAALVLIVGLLIRGMIRDRKAGKSPCGGNCAACGACKGCSGCSEWKAALAAKPANNVSGSHPGQHAGLTPNEYRQKHQS